MEGHVTHVTRGTIFYLRKARELDLPVNQVVHIWVKPNTDEALCGSEYTHECPESVDGGYAKLPPFARRCYCNAKVCEVCHKMWSGG